MTQPTLAPAVEVRRVVKAFGPVEALAGIDMTIATGEAVGLLGPNGAGKTTLLSLVTGLRRPDSGTVRLFGGSPLDPRMRAGLGVTPQTTALPVALRVREVAALVAAHYPDPRPTPEMLEAFGLARQIDAQCGSLSGGQQRRLLVALALIGRPRLVVLDEPTTGLDLAARETLWAALRAYRADGGTLLVTSHYLQDIEALTSRVVLVSEGLVVADGTVAQIRAATSAAQVRFALDPDHRRDTERHRLQHRADRPDLNDLTALHTLPGVSEVSRDELTGIHTLSTSDADATVTALVARGLPFHGLAVQPASLDDAVRLLLASREGA